MRILFLGIVLATGLAGTAFWLAGGMDTLEMWARNGQREFQNAMATALRALRADEPEALTTLLVVCFAYGFFHAVGPGHGKVLIGGYGVGRQVGLLRLSSIALASSLMQALTAILMVYSGVLLFDWSRSQMVQITENIMAPISYGAIALIGVWLLWRGLRGLHRLSKTNQKSCDVHSHDHSDICPSCGHSHAHNWREMLMLIGGIAIRPCSGALFLLVLTWRMQIELAGILGAFAMGLGTGSVTVAVAIASVFFRNSALLSFGSGKGLAYLVPMIEVLAGSIVVIAALQLLGIALL